MGNKKETTYKLGNLPFMFLSREHYGPYTIFKNGDNVELRIKTEMLDKNKSIVKTQQFSMLEDLVSRAERAIVQSGKQDQVTITIDNVNSIVISDTNTENEVVIDPSSETAETEMRGALADVGIVNFNILESAKKSIVNTGKKAGNVIVNKWSLLGKSGKDLFNDFYVLNTIGENYLNRIVQSVKALASKKEMLKFLGLKVSGLKSIYKDTKYLYEKYEQLINKIGSKAKFKAVQNVKLDSEAINSRSGLDLSSLRSQINQLRKLYDQNKLDAAGQRKLREAISKYKAATEGNFSVKNFADKEDIEGELEAGTFAPRTENKVKTAAANLFAKLILDIDKAIEAIDNVGNQARIDHVKTVINNSKDTLSGIKTKVSNLAQTSNLTKSQLDQALEEIGLKEDKSIENANEEIKKFFEEEHKDLIEEAKQNTTDQESDSQVNEEDLNKVLNVLFPGSQKKTERKNFKDKLTSNKLEQLKQVLSEFNVKPFYKVQPKYQELVKNLELSNDSKKKLNKLVYDNKVKLNQLYRHNQTSNSNSQSNNDGKIDLFSEKRNFGSNNNKVQVQQAVYKIFGGSEDKCKQWAKVFKAKDLVKATYNRLLNQNDKTKKNFETALSKFVKSNPGKQQVANLIQVRTEAYAKHGTNQLLFSSNNVYGLADTLLANFAKNKEGWVKDSENGRVYQDKYGTQWSSDKPDATPVFESKDGKDDPRNFKPEENKDEGDATMSEDEMDDVLGMGDESGGDDDDLFGGDESDSGDDLFGDDESSDSGDDDLFGGDDSDSGGGDDMFSEDDDDIFGDESGSDDDDLFGDSEEEGSEDDDFGFGDEDLETEEDTDMTSKQAIETIGDIAMKLIDKLK